jgi:hypothetical protein
VVASGFLDPAQNSDGPAFGLFAALPEGGELVELPAEDLSKAMVQVIHNSSDAAASTVDIYKNDMILLDDFNFRSASPFVEVTAGTLLDISVQPSSSSDTVGSLAKFTYNLLPDEKYILVATGLVSTSGYDPVKPFDMAVFQRARTEASTSGNTDVLVYHGSTDAPVVDVFESSVPAGTLVDNLAYKSFSSDYLELATADYILDIQDETGSTTVQRYEAGLNELGLSNSALVVLASGFLSPENNSNGAEFGLYVALPSGGELVALPVYTAETVTNINEILLSDQNFAVYPNPVQNQLNIDIQMENAENIQVELYDILGKKVADLSPVNRSYNDLTIRYDVGNLDKGLYFISVTDGNSRVTKKIQIGN